MIEFIEDDGGRAKAGYRGEAGDCVSRALAIATGRPYLEAYAALAEANKVSRVSNPPEMESTTRTGIEFSPRSASRKSNCHGVHDPPSPKPGIASVDKDAA